MSKFRRYLCLPWNIFKVLEVKIKNSNYANKKKRQQKIRGVDQFKTMFSIAKKEDLLGTMPVLLILMFLPFFQTVFFDKQRTAPQSRRKGL